MFVYCVTAVDWEGHAVAAWIMAANPDEATSKAIRTLPGGRISHLVRICNADLKTFNRNKLDKLLAITDRIEFTAAALLELVGYQQFLIGRLQEVVTQLQETANTINESEDN